MDTSAEQPPPLYVGGPAELSECEHVDGRTTDDAQREDDPPIRFDYHPESSVTAITSFSTSKAQYCPIFTQSGSPKDSDDVRFHVTTLAKVTPERLADVLDAGEDFVLLDTRSDRKKPASYERVVDVNRGVEDVDA